jgi:cell division protein FtsA
MNKNRIVASIEIGSSKITTLIAQVNTEPATYHRSINIAGVATVPSSGIKKGQIVNIEEAVEATVASVEAAERMAGYNLETAYVSVGGASISSQNSHGVVAVSDPEGEINDSDVDRVIEAASAISLPASRELIHVIPREFTVDGEQGVKDPVGMSGIRLEVETHMVTASSASVKNIRKAIQEVGVDIEELVFCGIASAESVASQTEKELGCVVIDIGGGTTSVVAYTDGALVYSGVIPIGARNVTNDLAIGLRVSLETAEKIKISLSREEKAVKMRDASDELDLEKLGIEEVKKVSKKTLVEGIIRPRLNEMFTMVRIELDKAGLSARVPSGAIITGGGAQTVGLSDSAKRMLSLPVRIGVPQGVGGLIDDIQEPAFASPVGLILYGAAREPVQITGSLSKRFKLPTKGLAGKVISSIRDLLP